MNRWFALFVGLGIAVCPLGTSRSEDKKPREVKDWGTVTDPEGDCTIKEEKGKLTISVPGVSATTKSHDLHPGNFGNRMFAPRVLREVEGDFTATVKVTGEFDPGELGFNGAGLLLWQDEKNIVRLERNKYWVSAQKKHYCYPPLFEYFKDAKYQNTDPKPTSEEFFKGKSTYLRMERNGEKLTAFYSHDGKEWTTAKEITVDLKSKLRVGVAALNTAKTPFTAEFEGFSVVLRK